MLLVAVLMAIGQQAAQTPPAREPPKFGAVGVRGAIDGAGYSAPATEKAQSRLVRDLIRIASRLPCPRSAEQDFFAQGAAFYAQGQTDKARQVFMKGQARYPDSTLLAIGRGALLYNDGYSTEARDMFLEAARRDTASSEPFLFLARLAAIPGAVDPASLSPFAKRNARAKFAYAQSLITAGREQQAEPLLKESIAADPAIAEAHFQMGSIYGRRGQLQKAIAEYRRALELDATLTEAHYRLGQLYMRTGQKEEGEKELRMRAVRGAAESVPACP